MRRVLWSKARLFADFIHAQGLIGQQFTRTASVVRLGENPMKAKIPFLVMIVLLVLAQACTPAMGPDQVATGVAATLTALPLPRFTHRASRSNGRLADAEQPSLTPAPEAVADSAVSGRATLPRHRGMRTTTACFTRSGTAVRGCHYDHEHGQNPFTPEVAATFPGFDLRALLGGVRSDIQIHLRRWKIRTSMVVSSGRWI